MATISNVTVLKDASPHSLLGVSTILMGKGFKIFGVTRLVQAQAPENILRDFARKRLTSYVKAKTTVT